MYTGSETMLGAAQTINIALTAAVAIAAVMLFRAPDWKQAVGLLVASALLILWGSWRVSAFPGMNASILDALALGSISRPVLSIVSGYGIGLAAFYILAKAYLRRVQRS